MVRSVPKSDFKLYHDIIYDPNTAVSLADLAVSEWNGLGLVSAHVVIDAFLELLGDQSSVFPATL